MKKCEDCGKEIQEKYQKCYECHQKKEQEAKKMTDKEDNWVNTSQKINMPMWAAIAIFIAGIILGAIIW